MRQHCTEEVKALDAVVELRKGEVHTLRLRYLDRPVVVQLIGHPTVQGGAPRDQRQQHLDR